MWAPHVPWLYTFWLPNFSTVRCSSLLGSASSIQLLLTSVFCNESFLRFMCFASEQKFSGAENTWMSVGSLCKAWALFSQPTWTVWGQSHAEMSELDGAANATRIHTSEHWQKPRLRQVWKCESLDCSWKNELLIKGITRCQGAAYLRCSGALWLRRIRIDWILEIREIWIRFEQDLNKFRFLKCHFANLNSPGDCTKRCRSPRRVMQCGRWEATPKRAAPEGPVRWPQMRQRNTTRKRKEETT